MTFRTLTTTAVMAGATALAQAPHSATLILRNGDRVTGLVRQASEPPAPVSASPAARTFHVRMADGQQLSVAAEDVAVIDFVGGRPSTAELDALGADTPHLMTLRNGNSRSGRLVGILGGDVVRWESQAGARVEVPIRNVTRIYLDQETALELFREEYRVPFLSPELAAYLATAIEVVTPVLLVLGLFTRLSALVLLGMATVIQVFVYPLAWPTHIQWAAMLLVLLARGPGKVSLDWLIRQRLLGER